MEDELDTLRGWNHTQYLLCQFQMLQNTYQSQLLEVRESIRVELWKLRDKVAKMTEKLHTKMVTKVTEEMG